MPREIYTLHLNRQMQLVGNHNELSEDVYAALGDYGRVYDSFDFQIGPHESAPLNLAVMVEQNGKIIHTLCKKGLPYKIVGPYRKRSPDPNGEETEPMLHQFDLFGNNLDTVIAIAFLYARRFDHDCSEEKRRQATAIDALRTSLNNVGCDIFERPVADNDLPAGFIVTARWDGRNIKDDFYQAAESFSLPYRSGPCYFDSGQARKNRAQRRQPNPQ